MRFLHFCYVTTKFGRIYLIQHCKIKGWANYSIFLLKIRLIVLKSDRLIKVWLKTRKSIKQIIETNKHYMYILMCHCFTFFWFAFIFVYSCHHSSIRKMCLKQAERKKHSIFFILGSHLVIISIIRSNTNQ